MAKAYQRLKGRFGTTGEAPGDEKVAAIVRDALERRLDDLWLDVESLFEARGLDRADALALYQLVLLRLFPEEYLDDSQFKSAKERARAAGLIPRGGAIERVGLDRLRMFAKLVTEGPPKKGKIG